MNHFIGTSKEPRYMQVCRSLLRAVGSGEYPIGALLPPEAALCEQYAVSRTTVREALRQLSEQGVVEKLHGIGTVVKNAEPRSNFVVAVNATNSMQYGRETTLSMIDRLEFVSDPSHVRLFGCGPGEAWIRVRGVRARPEDVEHPISMLEVYLPERYAGVARQDMIGDQPYHQRIAQHYQVQVVGIEQEIQAVSIGDEAARHLNVKAGSPGLYVIRRFIAADGKLIQASLNTHPSERFSYRFYLNQLAG